MPIKSTSRSFLKKTLLLGAYTLVSKCSGLIRDMLMVRYFGASALSDAFFVAFRIPNSLRKIFAEGALSAVFVPSIVSLVRKGGNDAASKLLSLMLVLTQSIVLLICCCIWWKSELVIHSIAPGWSHLQDALAQTAQASSLLRIVIFFIFFISSSALFAGALQALNHFSIPALGQVLINITTIAGLIICMQYHLSVEYLALFIVLGSLLQLIAHIAAYLYYNFKFLWPDTETWHHAKNLLIRFIPCILSMGIVEINLFIDAQFASFLPEGSLSLMTYAANIMRIPLGIFVTAFSTILLPHISRTSSYAPQRLSYYLLEATKMILWATLPASSILSFFSPQILSTLYSSHSLTIDQTYEIQHLLIAFLLGLFFFSFNKIVLTMYYALHDAFTPTLVSIIATACNIALNFLLIGHFKALGLVMATALASALQAFIFIGILRQKFNFKMYIHAFGQFIYRYSIQLLSLGTIFYGIYRILFTLCRYLPLRHQEFFMASFGFWLWAGPLSGIFALTVYASRHWFGVKLYFLDKAL